MKAALCTAYGGPEVIRLGVLPSPQVGPGQVLIGVEASTVSAADRRIRAQDMPRGFGLAGRLVFGLWRPRQPVLGTDCAGRVLAVGPGVVRFAPGDAVIALTGMACGCHAERLVLPESAAITAAPRNLAAAEAVALLFGGTAALALLRDRGKLQPGERLLILGAAGAVGAAAIQVASLLGAEVTAAARGERGASLRALGAAHILPRSALARPALAGPRWDMVLETTGAYTLADLLPCLTPRGRVLLAAADLPQMLAGLANPLRRQQILSRTVPERAQDLRQLAEWAEAGQLVPWIDSRFPLDRIADAHRRQAAPGRLGSVVVEMAPGC